MRKQDGDCAHKTGSSSEPSRSLQIAAAQAAYRKRRRQDGFKRLQEWLPDEALLQLKHLGKKLGKSRWEVIELAVEEMFKKQLEESGDGNRKQN